jgi:hypothetical protein
MAWHDGTPRTTWTDFERRQLSTGLQDEEVLLIACCLSLHALVALVLLSDQVGPMQHSLHVLCAGQGFGNSKPSQNTASKHAKRVKDAAVLSGDSKASLDDMFCKLRV